MHIGEKTKESIDEQKEKGGRKERIKEKVEGMNDVKRKEGKC